MADTNKPTLRTDRRQAARVKVNLQARWERNRTRRPATVTSLSSNGCFMLSGGRVKPKEFVRLHITLPNGEKVTAVAEVVDYASEIGFAVRFNYLEVPHQLRLEEYVEQCLKAESS